MRISRILSLSLLGLGFMLVAGMASAQNITLGSWRTDDVAKWTNIIAAFNKANPAIAVKFDPTNPPDYNATLRLQLENGNGPDLYFSRSFGVGKELFTAGFDQDLTDFAAIKGSFAPGSLLAWTADNNKVFAQPLGAVSHGIYFNKDLFAKTGIQVPKTWEDLIKAAAKLKAAGITPFANGIADQWDIYEIVLSGILANNTGGAPGRLAYEAGKRPFNDAAIVNSFAELKDMAPYLPKGFEALTYTDAENLFKLGKAAMLFDGSWELPDIQANVSFGWSIFAIPPPAGKPGFVVFFPDSAIAINSKSKNVAAAKTFLTWLASPAGAKAIGDNLVGFFPMSKDAVKLDNEYANTFLGFNKGTGQDIRFTWSKLDAGKPTAYSLLVENANNVLKGSVTPKQAADNLAAGLAQWYKP